MRMLTFCGALAAGEFLASFFPHAAEAWPSVAILVVLVALFGYGLDLFGWRHLCLVLLGMALFLCASLADERRYRDQPWMRGRERRERRFAEDPNMLRRTVKHDLSQRIGLGLAHDRETVALERAILLGERDRLPQRTKQIFVESGTMHVFAISGLHVMAIADVLAHVLSLAFLPRRFVGLTAIPLLWGYVALIGAPPSAVRAAIMATFSFLAPLFWRKPDGIRSWALTFLLVHLLSPQLIVHVGNVLSFAVMLAIVLVGKFTRSMRRWQQTLLVTLAAWAVGVPIAARMFGQVTPGGMLANLVLLAAAKLTVVTGVLGLGLSYLSKTVAAHLNNLSALGIRLMVLIADIVARLPGSHFETGCWSLLTCAEWYAALVLIAYLVHRIRSRSI